MPSPRSSDASADALAIDRPFIFLFTFDWSDRSGLERVLDAYVSEFRAGDPVALTLVPASVAGLSVDEVGRQLAAALHARSGGEDAEPHVILQWVAGPDAAAVRDDVDRVISTDIQDLRAWMRDAPAPRPREHLGDRDVDAPRVGIVLLNYNLPRETDALVRRLRQIVRHPSALVVLDNASDRQPPATSTTARAPANARTGGGNLIGAHLLTARHPDIEFLMFLHNDMRFEHDDCPITPLVAALRADPDAAAVHPVIASGVTLGDRELLRRPGGGVRPAPRNVHGRVVIDDICPVLVRRRDYFDVGGFDPRLTRCYGAGLDLYNRLAERGRTLVICDDVEVFHQGQYTYAAGVGDESHASCDAEASLEMDVVFTEKYGADWRSEFGRDPT